LNKLKDDSAIVDYRGEKLVKSEYDAITEIEKDTGAIPIALQILGSTFGIVIQDAHVTALGLVGKRLTALPESIGNLTSLQRLDLSRNELTSLPESITRITSLQRLYLEANQLTSILESITRLTSLKWLDLNQNKITSLPQRIESALKKLEDRGCFIAFSYYGLWLINLNF